MRARARMGWMVLVVGAVIVGAGPSSPAVAADDERGWSWLIDRLAVDGVPRAEARAVFRDWRVDPFDGMYFSLRPRESHAMYRGHLGRASVASARRCRAAHLDTLQDAEQRTGVSADVVAAIIHVESACGRNTGSQEILPPLARLAMAREPDNLARNVARHTAGLTGDERDAVEDRTRARAAKLDEMFYPQVLATFEVARRLGVHPLGLRGSGAGAFGIPQFLPASYLAHGFDGDGDGRVSLYDHEDAIHSAARYLAAHGWRPGLSRAERREVIWAYNHSDAYIDTVLALADRLGGPDEPEPVRVAAPRPRSRAARHAAGGRHGKRVVTAKAATRKGTRAPVAATRKGTRAPVRVAASRKPVPKAAATHKAPAKRPAP